MRKQKEWFESWFDSPFHEKLYQHRDEHEAHHFIDNLFAYLKPSPDSKALDIACGDGRHAAYMSKSLGEVIGIDLSENRLERALQHAHEHLEFYLQDMRNVFRSNYFDFSFNFFTSFGYFEQFADTRLAADAFAKGLKSGGKLVLDYMNVNFVVENLVKEETVKIDNTVFEISRELIGSKIVKTIDIETSPGIFSSFKESVSAFYLSDFEKIFEGTGLHIVKTFGNYDLNHFDLETSPRLIMVFEKD